METWATDIPNQPINPVRHISELGRAIWPMVAGGLATLFGVFCVKQRCPLSMHSICTENDDDGDDGDDHDDDGDDDDDEDDDDDDNDHDDDDDDEE